MKTRWHHYLLARTGGFSIGLGVVGALLWMGLWLWVEGLLVADTQAVVWMLVAAVPVGAVGWILGGYLIWQLLGHSAARIQGWPFVVGDRVRVLSGQHRGKVARVYEVWECRGQIRLELGKEEMGSASDVFCAVSVTRVEFGDD